MEFLLRKAVFILVIYLFSFTSCEQVQFKNCRKPALGYTNKCAVHDVHISPCPEAANNAPCAVKQNGTTAITFNFTPQFSGKTESRVYWNQILVDLPFLGMDTDACKFSTCPTEVGTKNAYTFSLFISPTYPVGVYPIKWRLWNEEKSECCFLANIRITS